MEALCHVKTARRELPVCGDDAERGPSCKDTGWAAVDLPLLCKQPLTQHALCLLALQLCPEDKGGAPGLKEPFTGAPAGSNH